MNQLNLKSKTALLIIAVIGDFEFEDGEKLCKNALPTARNVADLKNGDTRQKSL